ncbi:hypothetical protein AABB24_014546, partial [Solanum stoloniferum]
SILKTVDKICRDYLWGRTTDKRKIALVSWDKVCTPKKCGGLSIKSSKQWNTASVGKLIWQLSRKKDILWLKWVHGIYMKTFGSIRSRQIVVGIGGRLTASKETWDTGSPMECTY